MKHTSILRDGLYGYIGCNPDLCTVLCVVSSRPLSEKCEIFDDFLCYLHGLKLTTFDDLINFYSCLFELYCNFEKNKEEIFNKSG